MTHTLPAQPELLNELKLLIDHARQRAAAAVNAEFDAVVLAGGAAYSEKHPGSSTR